MGRDHHVGEFVAHAGAYALRAEARALLAGQTPRAYVDELVGELVWRVRADTDPWHLGEYRVRLASRDLPGSLVHLTCECPAGHFYSHLPVPCRHAAIVGRWLEVRDLAAWRRGLWYRPGTKTGGSPVPDDPFEGLT